MASLRLLLGSLTAVSVAASVYACGSDTSLESNETTDGGAEHRDGALPAPTRAEFGLDARPQNPSCRAPARPPSAAPVAVEQVFSNVQLGASMMMAQSPGDGSRWFVAQRGGTIATFPTTAPGNVPTQVASVGALSGLTVNTSGEGGLLGLAFHPRFAQNGRLYVTWTSTGGANGMRSHLGYLQSADGGASFTSYHPVLSFDQVNATNHKGGGIAFGKDGYLYASFGDGGSGDDAFEMGQRKTTFFSKIVRVDVDAPPAGQTYGIPADNPFASGGGEPATFAYGFRNPFRFSIDRETGEVWVGDVGQNKWEEVNLVERGGNYGWPCREGTHDYITSDTDKCPSMANLQGPVFEQEHVPSNTRSITGGVVYRGAAIPTLVGSYIYGDYIQQALYVLSFDPTDGTASATTLDDAPAAAWGSFAEDADGEVYAVSLGGSMYKIVPKGEPPTSTFPDRLSKTGCFDNGDPKQPAPGLVPYGVNAPLWSDGAEKERFMALPDGLKIAVGDDGDFDFPNGTVLTKTFSLAGKRIETRLFMRHDDGGWAGYTYEWLDDESDAVLLPSSKKKTIGDVAWHYPSRAECVRCHTAAAGRSLGLELGQQNGDFVYTSTNRISNQLRTLEHIGMLAEPLGPIGALVSYPSPAGGAPVEARARAYLHANCSMCHRPSGGGRGDLNLLFGTSLEGAALCDATPEAGDLGVSGAKLLLPGDPARSLVSVRPRRTGSGRMPPLASSVVDAQGMGVVDEWIRGLTHCP